MAVNDPRTDRELLLVALERMEAIEGRLKHIDECLDKAKDAALIAKTLSDQILKTDYVSRVEFWPVRAIVYGGAGIVLAGVVSGGVALIVR